MVNPTSLELYKKMFLIRRSEEKIREHYGEDDMKTPMHMSMGEEAVVAGVCQALRPGDQAVGTYRSHALFLAKTGLVEEFFAEMYGKVSGTARGRAGSMHLCSVEHGLLCCSAIVASSIPVALGTAFANKYKRNGRVTAAFFGDGAVDEGVFWESVNFASLRKLPIVFVCEDNRFAVHTRSEERHGFRSLADVVSKYECSVFEESSTDADTVYAVAREAVESAANAQRPALLVLHYYRYLEHVGINEDFNAGYRDRAEFLEWLAKDPVALQRRKLIEQGMPESQVEELEAQTTARIVQSIEKAKSADFPDESELNEGVFG